MNDSLRDGHRLLWREAIGGDEDVKEMQLQLLLNWTIGVKTRAKGEVEIDGRSYRKREEDT